MAFGAALRCQPSASNCWPSNSGLQSCGLAAVQRAAVHIPHSDLGRDAFFFEAPGRYHSAFSGILR